MEDPYSTANVAKRKATSAVIGFGTGTLAGTVAAGMAQGMRFGPPQVKAGMFLGFILGVGGVVRTQ